MTTAVIRSRDDDGRLVVGVPLSNRSDRRAWLYESDYEAILAEYGRHSWFVNDNGKGKLYVRMTSTDRTSADRPNNVMVARLIVGDPLARYVRYGDGDTLNLRSRNLRACRSGRDFRRRAHPALLTSASDAAAVCR